MRIKILILLVSCFVMASMVSGEVVDVDPGTDVISAAMQNAYPGDELVLSAGDYYESNTVLSHTGGITIRGADGAEVIWHAPDTVVTILVKGNLRLANIIFLSGNDLLRAGTCILNDYGLVVVGEEAAAEKNSLFIDNCMFLLYGTTKPSFKSTIEIPETHPLDTLYVTNSLFYGGLVGMYRGIDSDHGQVHVVKIQNCTGWKIVDDAFQVNGHEVELDYVHLLIDHITVYNGSSLEFPDGREAVGTYTYNLDANDTIRNGIFKDLSDFGIKAKKGNFAEATYDYSLGHNIGWNCEKCSAWYYAIKDANALGLNLVMGDPLFTDADNGDFSLMAGSPGIGTGHDGSNKGNLITDWTRAVELAGPSVGVEQVETRTAETFRLAQNYPNPFNPSTTINYSLEKPDQVSLNIYSVTGQNVRTLVNEMGNSGIYSVVWDGLDNQGLTVAGGVYFYRLQVGSNVTSMKMVLMK